MSKGISKKIFLAMDKILTTGEIIFARENLMTKLRKLENLDGTGMAYANQIMKRAVKKNWIDILEKNGKTFYKITPLGTKKINKYKFRELKIIKNRWDGIWRLIMFDIPEEKKLGREALRGKLKALGFYRFQKSVFVCPFECEREIAILSGFFNISEYVEIVLTRSLGKKEAEVRMFFGV